ncbi:glycoside hydrolase family 35 protein [Russula earlei]|uniref:Glycoside hydrolase family 35 protein n=1 Tax=Russula earlei TaxID=71964 RepID=A0ACC0TYZ4_9AGAM|nr:glycoside hydrolase family 35 protein [Russula earlei]
MGFPDPTFPPFSSNGRTDQVQWDKYTLVLHGQRVLIYSGELHTFRLPVPSLWLDILQKVKAAGLNAVSLYTHWGLLNPSPGVVDFGSFRALQPLFDAALVAGVWVVLRPGPYINAETTAGGIAHWVTSQTEGSLRTNATDFHAAWQDYIEGIIIQTAPNQITEGGPVIDNEYFQSAHGTARYFAELEEAYHNSSIVVPLTYNDPGEGRNFVNGTGAVDIYGFDSYPQGFDCSHQELWNPVVTHYYEYHEETNPSQPFYVPEFQGGSFDAWGPTAPGYASCREMTGPSFQSVFYRQLWASNAKLMNFYMFYGGTSWGGLPFPGVYTSYDYGAAVEESREITSKFTELKSQGLFLRSSPEFLKTDRIGNSTSGPCEVSNPAAFVTLLKNPDTGTCFWIARQANSSSTALTAFNLTVTTSVGTISIPQTVPNITLKGRQSKVIVTDYHYGSSGFILWSTAPIFFAGRIGTRDVLYVTADRGEPSELALSHSGRVDLRFPEGVEGGGPFPVIDTNTSLVLVSTSYTAGIFFAPILSGIGPHANYWQIGTNSSVLVGGPHLVRNASLGADGTLALNGDLNASVTLQVIGPPRMTAVTWNGKPVLKDTTATSSLSRLPGTFVGNLTFSNTKITVPTLATWKFSDSLPEIQATFDDSNWIVANHTTTNIPFKPYYGDGRVLYGCDYGFCENIVLWRGHFNSTGQETSVNLSINGGEAFAASVWLNSHFLGTSFGNSTNNRHILEETDDEFTFPTDALIPSADNVVTIVQPRYLIGQHGPKRDERQSVGPLLTSGLSSEPVKGMTDDSKSPRGVRGFKLNNGTFCAWKVQGKVGGYTGFPDTTRGVLNEGGLFGERAGWHLPEFDTRSWVERPLSAGLPHGAAGVGFFVTTFPLNIPAGLDVMLSFTFDDTAQPYRALLFVNGWMMGKRVANLGPQFKFPVHQGILDYGGTNTVAVALWAMAAVPIAPTLELTLDTVLEGGVGPIVPNNPAWTPDGREISERSYQK